LRRRRLYEGGVVGLAP